MLLVSGAVLEMDSLTEIRCGAPDVQVADPISLLVRELLFVIRPGLETDSPLRRRKTLASERSMPALGKTMQKDGRQISTNYWF